MKLERVAIVSLFEAIPWAPIVLGLQSGLERLGLQVLVQTAAPAWYAAEQVRRWSPHVVLVALHDRMRPHVPAWRDLVPRSVPFAALCFDDPYDMATPLALLRHFDLMLTPERTALLPYEERGVRARPLAPVICDDWHHLPTEAAVRDVDVLHVGGNQWAPRRALLPQIVKRLTGAGYVFAEAAGQARWIVGRDLTQMMHRSRLTLDVPRWEFFASTNPLGLPCTYAGPRVHIAAACGTPCLCVEPRGDLELQFPGQPTCSIEDAPSAVLEFLREIRTAETAAPGQLHPSAVQARKSWELLHAPQVRAAQLLDHLRELTGAE